MHPVCDDESIPFALSVSKTEGVVIVGSLLSVIGIWIIGDLKEVVTKLSVYADLVSGGPVMQQR